MNVGINDFLKVLKYYNTKQLKDNGNSYRACCPIHRGNNPTSFVLRKDNGLFYCHAGCGGGDIITFIELMENVDFNHAVNKLSEILGVNVKDINFNEHDNILEENALKWIEFVKNLHNNKIEEYTIPDIKLYNIKSYRNFTTDTIEYFGLKYAENFPIINSKGETKTLNKRLVFPIYFNNKLVGVTLRRINNKDNPKWLHQPTSIKTGHILYNYDNIQPFKPIIIVEGILDVWKYHQLGITNVIATFGANLTKEQEKLLIKKTDTVILSYDNDDAGNKATQKVIEQLRYKTNLHQINLPDGLDPYDTDDKILLNNLEHLERVI